MVHPIEEHKRHAGFQGSFRQGSLALGSNYTLTVAPGITFAITPAKLAVTSGKVDTTDADDYDGDGFNEVQGCYVLNAEKDVAFALPAGATGRMFPAFKIKDWTGETPKSIKAGAKDRKAGADFNASVVDGVLLVQLLSVVREDTGIVIPVVNQEREKGTSLILGFICPLPLENSDGPFVPSASL